MKTKTLAVLALACLFPALGFAQPVPAVPPTAPVPAVPPVPPSGDKDRERLPKVPVTFLGVETSEVPTVVAEQLGLAKGFGLVVDYVVPDGPAAAAGVQANDILKLLNDQILTEPDQLAKLIRSFNEGTSVTLTVLRKGAETKLTAKLGKKEVPQRRDMRGWRNGKGFGDLGPEFNEKMKKLGEELGEMDFSFGDMDFSGMFDQDVVRHVREEARDAEREARQAAREAQRGAQEVAREAARAARDATREAARAFRYSRPENGGLRTTRIDMNKAQIVYHDAQGELKVENVSGKKVLTAKDAQGRLVFSGPVETKEELDKLPAEVRQRYDKLEQKDLPAIAPTVTNGDHDHDADDAGDADDVDEVDSDDQDVEVNAGTDVLQVSCPATAPASAQAFDLNIVLI